MSENKDAVRRAKIFSVLDAMKDAGDKITAQKLAATVNMGKQTVLPLYREWQELDVLGDSEGIELSVELLRTLKRELARDKFRQSGLQMALEERIEDQRSDFDAIIIKREQDIKALSEKLKAFEHKNQVLHTERLELQSQTAEQLSVIASLESRYSLAETQLETTELKLQTSENSKEKALQEQEQRLDNASQKLLNHWLSVVDTERREKERLQKQLEREQEKRLQRERELTETKNDAKTLDGTLKRMSSEYQSLQKHAQQLEGPATLAETISFMLDRPKDLTEAIKILKSEVKLLDPLKDKSQSLTNSLEEAHKKVASFEKVLASNQLMDKEIIRLQAYIEGLQQAIAKEIKAPSKKKKEA